MGIFVLLPLVLPLTAWPIAYVAERHLHPRSATRLLCWVGGTLAASSTLCLGLLMVVGTAQLPGNPLPDAWSDPQVRAAVPHHEIVGKASIAALTAVVVACTVTVVRHRRLRHRAVRALAGSPRTGVVVLDDAGPYAHVLPGGRGRRGRIVVSTGMLGGLSSRERRALFAHERAHLAGRHHRHLLMAQLAGRANPFLHPLRQAVVYCVERWADEEAAHTVRDRRATARAVGKAALITQAVPGPLMAFAAAGPIPRRVAALLGPLPTERVWPPSFTAVGLALWTAAAGAATSALSSANATVTLLFILKAATPL